MSVDSVCCLDTLLDCLLLSLHHLQCAGDNSHGGSHHGFRTSCEPDCKLYTKAAVAALKKGVDAVRLAQQNEQMCKAGLGYLIPGPDGQKCAEAKETYAEAQKDKDLEERQLEAYKQDMDSSCAIVAGPPGPRGPRRGPCGRHGYPRNGHYRRPYSPRRNGAR